MTIHFFGYTFIFKMLLIEYLYYQFDTREGLNEMHLWSVIYHLILKARYDDFQEFYERFFFSYPY